jgi:hypothetical protein
MVKHCILTYLHQEKIKVPSLSLPSQPQIPGPGHARKKKRKKEFEIKDNY